MYWQCTMYCTKSIKIYLFYLLFIPVLVCTGIWIRIVSTVRDPQFQGGSGFKLSVWIRISIIYLVFFIFPKNQNHWINLHWSESALEVWIRIPTEIVDPELLWKCMVLLDCHNSFYLIFESISGHYTSKNLHILVYKLGIIVGHFGRSVIIVTLSYHCFLKRKKIAIKTKYFFNNLLWLPTKFQLNRKNFWLPSLKG